MNFSIKNIDFDVFIKRVRHSQRQRTPVVGHILDYEILCPGADIGFYSGNPIPLASDQESCSVAVHFDESLPAVSINITDPDLNDPNHFAGSCTQFSSDLNPKPIRNIKYRYEVGKVYRSFLKWVWWNIFRKEFIFYTPKITFKKLFAFNKIF